MRVLAVALAFSFSSCGGVTTVDICVKLPDPPPCWPEELKDCPYVLRYLEEPGSVGELVVAPGNEEAYLTISKLPVVPVTAVPQYGTPPAAVRPCGAVYPADLGQDGTLRLSWEEGFLAELCLRCAGSGDHLQAVHIEKLRSFISKRSDGNPWLLDPAAISSAIAGGTLSARSLKTLPRSDVMLQAAPGRWVSGNPTNCTPVECHGTLILSGLPQGVHSYFALGDEGRIDISIVENGWIAIDMSATTGSSGNW
jgi:hypothetical protein